MTPESVPAEKTVLVVDDDDDVRETISAALDALGYNVLFARDGRDALDVLSAVDNLDELCVVLADVHMPRLDGPGLARAIRSDPKLAHVRILVVSSSPEYGEGVADETMAKPFAVPALRASVERLCAQARPHARRPS
jgi:CheY-like chemotaxis protein